MNSIWTVQLHIGRIVSYTFRIDTLTSGVNYKILGNDIYTVSLREYLLTIEFLSLSYYGICSLIIHCIVYSVWMVCTSVDLVIISYCLAIVVRVIMSSMYFSIVVKLLIVGYCYYEISSSPAYQYSIIITVMVQQWIALTLALLSHR